MSVCLCVCFNLLSLSHGKLSDLSHQGANHHDHSGDIMIIGPGGPARTRGCPAQGRRGPLRAPGVLRRAHSFTMQGPPPAGFCQCPRHATRRHATPRCWHATPSHATPRHATPRHATPRRAAPRHAAGTPCQATPRHATPRHATPRHATPQPVRPAPSQTARPGRHVSPTRP